MRLLVLACAWVGCLREVLGTHGLWSAVLLLLDIILLVVMVTAAVRPRRKRLA